jgi:DNA repair protein RecN (Recombination protein N)
MLALATVAEGSADTLIFDEIDTGIGGEAALAVGQYLAQLSKKERQVFVVTHLASIAVRADHQLLVAKHEEAGRTITEITALDTEQRRREIARMLSGDAAEPEALAHAGALLRQYAPGGA